MGSSTDNIAIEITTQADVSGVELARKSLGNLTVSQEQMRAALQKTDGDLQAAAKLLSSVAQEESRVTAATEQMNNAVQREAGVLQQAGTQLARVETTARGARVATTQVGAQFEQLSPKLRTTSNAVAILSQAAITGNGSMAGMAVAAGNVAQGVAAIAGSARIAAAATGIGALVSVLGLVIAAFEHFQTTVDETRHKFEDDVNAMVNAGDVAQLQKRAMDLWRGTPAKAFEDGISSLRSKLAEAQAELKRSSDAWDFKAFTHAKEEVADLTAKLKPLEEQFASLRAAILNPNNTPLQVRGLPAVRVTATGGEATANAAQHAQERIANLASETRALNDAIRGDTLAQHLEQINHAADVDIRQTKELQLLEKDREQTLGAIEARRKAAVALTTQEYDRTRAREVATSEQQAATSAQERYEAAVKLIELDRRDNAGKGLGNADAVAASRMRELDRAGDEALRSAQTQIDALIGQMQNAHDARKRAIEADYQSELRGLEQMTVAEGAHDQLLTSINDKRKYALELLQRETDLENVRAEIELRSNSSDPREQFKGRLAAIEEEKRAEIQAGIDIVTATAQAEQKKQQLYVQTTAVASHSFKSLTAEMLNSTTAAVRANESLKKVLTAAALEPIVKELEALSASESVKAIAHFASGDIGGGLAHSAAAIAASAAAAKVETLGGLGSSGGGGGGAGSGTPAPGSAPVYTPKDASGGGAVVVNLYTVDPYSSEAIRKTSYYLERSGITKQPIYVPATSGLAFGGA